MDKLIIQPLIFVCTALALIFAVMIIAIVSLRGTVKEQVQIIEKLQKELIYSKTELATAHDKILEQNDAIEKYTAAMTVAQKNADKAIIQVEVQKAVTKSKIPENSSDSETLRRIQTHLNDFLGGQ